MAKRGMTINRDELRGLLLGMIAPAPHFDPVRLRRLTGVEWEAFNQIASENGLEPMLDWCHGKLGVDWGAPVPIVARWRESARQSALRSLRIEQTLLRVAELLDEAAIPYAVLNGAALAWSVYPSPSLRTMRDVDILVGHELARAAYAKLSGAEFKLAGASQDAAQSGRDYERHFPPLASPVFDINVKLHFRLQNPASADPNTGHGYQAEAVLTRRIFERVRDRQIATLSPTDLALHVAVRAAYGHRFNHCPTLRSDFGLLARARPIDWGRFWRMAGEGGWTRGCQVAIALAAQAYGPLPRGAMTADENLITADMIEDAKRHLLRKPPERRPRRIGRWLMDGARRALGMPTREVTLRGERHDPLTLRRLGPASD